MKALIIYAHPWDGSYNHAILNAVIKGLTDQNVTIDILDLYKENFNPVLSVKDLAMYSKGKSADEKVLEYQKRIEAADILYIIFPVWWGTLPAILKGFFDKVFLKVWAYDRGLFGSLKGRIHSVKKAVVISTMNAPAWYYTFLQGNQIKHTLINGLLKTCGIKNVAWRKQASVIGVTREKRTAWLLAIEQQARSVARL